MRLISILGDAPDLAAAALIRALLRRGERVAAARVAAPTDARRGAVTREFVGRDGTLRPNAGFWLEWASGIMLAEHPAVAREADLLVVAVPDGAAVPQEGLALAAAALPVQCDRFGRPWLLAAPAVLGLVAEAPPAEAEGPPCRIGIVGSERHDRDRNPAVLVALADAADRAGVRLRPHFLDPACVRDLGLPGDLDGLVLPGGADMTQVPGQIAAADAALARDLPLLGVCLGMQTMVTAALRRAFWPDAVLEETDGPGPRRSFVHLTDAAGRRWHRRGESALCPPAESRLGRLLGDGVSVRMNHRFALSAAAAAQLPPQFRLHHGGMGIVDAVEAPEARFCIGLQGHPELGCDRRLRRLWDGLIAAARRNGVADAYATGGKGAP